MRDNKHNLSGRPLSELAAEINEIGYRLRTTSPEDITTEDMNTYRDTWQDLWFRDRGLYDVLSYFYDTDKAQQRIATLREHFKSLDSVLRKAILDRVPELPYFEIDTVFGFVEANLTRYYGDADNPGELEKWTVDFAVTAAKRTAFVHLVIREHKGVIYEAILRQLHKFSDLCSVEDKKDTLFEEIVALAWERGLHEPGSAKLSTRLRSLARKHTMNFTKSLTRGATKKRKLSLLTKLLVGSSPAKVTMIDSPSESEPYEPTALFCSTCGSLQRSITFEDVSNMFSLRCGHFRVNNLHSAIDKQTAIDEWKELIHEIIAGESHENGPS